MPFYKTVTALSAFILLVQQISSGFASPIPGDQNSSVAQNVSSSNEQINEPPTTSPPTEKPRGIFEGYPEVAKLLELVGPTGLYQEWLKSRDLPRALWNTTATNMTSACHQYLIQNSLSTPTVDDAEKGGCATTYVCDVQQNMRRFPAVMIRAECEQNRCENSLHLLPSGKTIVPGSLGSCQSLTTQMDVMVFQPERVQSRQSAEANGSTSEQRGEWEYVSVPIPTNCQCTAK